MLKKIIKYSVPVFVLAIVSRSIEEISFIYYAVPVMCVLFIVYSVRNIKRQKACPELAARREPRFQRVLGSKVKSLTKIEKPSRLPADEGTLTSKVSGKDEKDKDPSSKVKPSRLVYLFQQATLKVSLLLFLIPGLWFLLTSLWSPYPEVSVTRALYFLLISSGSIAAGFLWIRYSGKGIFYFLLPANIFVVLLCLFSIVTNIPSDSWTGGHGKGFMGFFGHQNLLASVILFTIPAVFAKLRRLVKSEQLIVNSKEIKVKSLFTNHYLLLTTYYLILTANLLILTLTYSRAAILSLLFGLILFLFLAKKWKLILYGFSAAAVLAIIIYLTPSLNQFADIIIKKDFPEYYSSRMWMWEPSYNAALEGGLTGLGYGISHPEIRSGEYSDHFENGRLIREKGNSTLALIEETGVIGLLLFLIPLFFILLRVVPGRDSLLSTNYSLLTAALAAFLLHSQFEAWWVGVGSVQLPLFFVYLGLIVQGSKSISSSNKLTNHCAEKS